MVRSLIAHCREVAAARWVLWLLIRQQLTLRYRRTVLGYLWTLVNPLMMMSVTAVVFATLFKMDLRAYAVFLFAGLIPFNLFSAIVTQSSGVFISNESLLKKIYIPRLVFPLNQSVALLVDGMLSFVALMIIIWFVGATLSWALLFIPVAFLLLFVFAFGIALVVPIITVYFRDLQHVIAIAMQTLFFLSPVLYDKNSLSGKLAVLINLNPIVPYIDLFRASIVHAQWPEPVTIALAAALSLTSLLLGYTFFTWQEKKFIFRL